MRMLGDGNRRIPKDSTSSLFNWTNGSILRFSKLIYYISCFLIFFMFYYYIMENFTNDYMDFLYLIFCNKFIFWGYENSFFLLQK